MKSRIKFILSAALLSAAGHGGLVAQGTESLRSATDTAACPCLHSTVGFDVSSIEKIILEPEEILEDIDRFWREDEAYRLVGQWHAAINQPPDLDGWRKRIEEIRDLPRSEREEHPHLVAARNLAGIEEAFVAKAVPFLCAFLPPEADLSTTVYFATEIIASGFQQSGDIVIHILNHKVHNLFIHEIFHRGYASIYARSGNPQPETDPIRRMYLAIHNEGMATYVGYVGQTEFPEVGEVGQSLVAGDYELLSDPREVKRLHRELNQLLREAPQLEPDKLEKRAWELGVNQRAYYIVGAYMAQLIDDTLGRRALVETITRGPRAFVESYNNIADKELMLFVI